MGRLAGFRYREITRKLRLSGFEFDRQAAGSHEIWFNPRTIGIQQCQTTPATCTLRAILKQAGIDVDGFLRA